MAQVAMHIHLHPEQNAYRNVQGPACIDMHTDLLLRFQAFDVSRLDMCCQLPPSSNLPKNMYVDLYNREG